MTTLCRHKKENGVVIYCLQHNVLKVEVVKYNGSNREQYPACLPCRFVVLSSNLFNEYLLTSLLVFVNVSFASNLVYMIFAVLYLQLPTFVSLHSNDRSMRATRCETSHTWNIVFYLSCRSLSSHCSHVSHGICEVKLKKIARLSSLSFLSFPES